MLNNVVDMLPKNRFEIEFICRIKIRGYRFWITIDHNGFIATFRSCQNTMYATVVKLYPLTDSIGTWSQNNNFFSAWIDTFVGNKLFTTLDLNLIFESRIIVRSLCLKLSSTSVDEFINALHAHFISQRVDLTFQTFQHMCDLSICKAFLFGFQKKWFRNIPDIVFRNLEFKIVKLFILAQKPHIDFGDFVDAIQRNTHLDGIIQHKHTIPRSVFEFGYDRFIIGISLSVGT